MRIISKKKQKECVARLIAIRKITDDMNCQSSLNEGKIDMKRWADNMEYLADNIMEIANVIGGIPAMTTILADVRKAGDNNENNN